mmetsp:Transcript_64036/g.180276  ORF Transcript_64036/g.180276 Transcript_64036/m.180276 type:complete len:324 (-) Transcript_64036:13-984(-)
MRFMGSKHSPRRNSASIMGGLYHPLDTGAQSIMDALHSHRRNSAPSIKNGGCCPRQTGAESIGTLLFVDVDGVLNVGIEDSGAMVELSSANVRQALEMKKNAGASEARNDLAEKVIATYNHEIGHGDATYAEYVSSTPFHCCKRMIGRLAQLIHAAGDNCTVVLSSSWRHPQHEGRVRRLERALSTLLGKKFRFHARTALVEDRSPGARLRAIGDFVSQRSRRCARPWTRYRVLVLDDFHVSAMDGWRCDGTRVDSTAAAEEYLRSRMPGHGGSSARVVHTFDKWTTPSGLAVRVGAGLTSEHFCSAMHFLSGDRCPHCVLSI